MVFTEMQGITTGIYNLIIFLSRLCGKVKFDRQKTGAAPCIGGKKMVLFYTV